MSRFFLVVLAAAGQALLGCQSMPFCPEEPQPDCATPAEVRYPTCRVLHCAEHPVLLQLADGRSLRPYGETWESFLAQPGTGQPQQVRISYRPEATPQVSPWRNATITCVSAAQ